MGNILLFQQNLMKLDSVKYINFLKIQEVKVFFLKKISFFDDSVKKYLKFPEMEYLSGFPRNRIRLLRAALCEPENRVHKKMGLRFRHE